MTEIEFVDYVWPVKEIKPYRFSLVDIKDAISRELKEVKFFENARIEIKYTPQFITPMRVYIVGDHDFAKNGIEIHATIRPPRRKRSQPEVVLHMNGWSNKINGPVKEALLKALESLKCYL